MSATGLAWNPVEQQLESLRTLIVELRHDVAELRVENVELRRVEGPGQNDDCEQMDIETVTYLRVVLRKRYRRTCACPDPPRMVKSV